MNRIPLVDLGFLIAESAASPKHVGGLCIVKKPPKAAAFAKALYKDFRAHTEVEAPFNQVLDWSFTSWPRWKKVKTVDIDQHVFFHKLPAGENDRVALFAYIARLHERLLDRSRPLWEMHVIDGLQDGKFCLYYKAHHAYADGVTLTHWTSNDYAHSPDDMDLRPMWSVKRERDRTGRPKRFIQDLTRTLMKEASGTSRQLIGSGRLVTMMLLEGARLTKNAIALPYVSSARTPLSGQISPGRQLANAAVPMARIGHIRERTRSTLNHVALTCLDAALHRYLKDQMVVLKQPLTIQMPVNLRKHGDHDAGNKIGIIQVELSPPTDDPYVRLRNIGFSLRNVRNMVDNVSAEALQTYTILTGLSAQILEILKLSNRLPPLANTLVSNVPGPRGSLYVRGAKFEEVVPVSTIAPGQFLNVTLFSYVDTLYFGFLGTDQLPNLQVLAQYTEEEFIALDNAI